MTFTFSKYHGAGNDFIMVDNRNGLVDDISVEQVSALCRRHFGVGADGLIRIENSTNADFKMVYHNADGKIGSMCGNGSRCAVLFAKEIGVEFQSFSFHAADGLHHFEILSADRVKVSMKDVREIKRNDEWTFIDTGSPHLIVPVNDLQNVDVYNDGKKIRYSPKFQSEGVNVNFVEAKNDLVEIRTYERGVENETMACGTGCVAAALWSAFENKTTGQHNVNLKAQGGLLNVSFNYNPGSGFTNVFLEGPVMKVFEGRVTA